MLIATAADVVPLLVGIAAILTAAGTFYAARAKRKSDEASSSVELIRAAQEIQREEIERLDAKVGRQADEIRDLKHHLSNCEKERHQLARRVAELEAA